MDRGLEAGPQELSPGRGENNETGPPCPEVGGLGKGGVSGEWAGRRLLDMWIRPGVDHTR